MAGAGFKTFNTGDVLTAADVNTYLMQQTVMVFASAAARTTALGASVAEGMLSYLKDTDQVEVYNGTSWVASDDPNAIQNSILDAKGDLISATAADTPARLAVGTNGQVLTADSTTSTGLKWAAASSGVNPQIPRLNSNYYLFPRSSTTNTTALLDENSWEPVFLPVCTISRISIKTSASFSGTASIRLGIYNNGADNVPTTVFLDASTVSCTAASTVYEITVNQAITTAGYYWLVFRTATAASTNGFVASSGTAFFTGTSASSTAGFLGVSDRIIAFTEGGKTGAFTTAGTLVATGASQPLVGVRIN